MAATQTASYVVYMGAHGVPCLVGMQIAKQLSVIFITPLMNFFSEIDYLV